MLFRRLMISVLCLWVSQAVAPTAVAQAISLTETVTVEGTEFPVPMEIRLKPESDTQMTMIVTGDLGALQDNLPALLSRRIEDGCENETAIAVDAAAASGQDLRLTGQIRTIRYLCSGEFVEDRTVVLRQTADIDLTLTGRVEDGCLVIRLKAFTLDPDGLGGAVLDLTGMTERMTRDVETRLERALGRASTCIDIPREFRMFDARVTGGGFRAGENGRLGAVIRADLTVTARNLVRLLRLLERDGKLGN